MPKRSVIGRKWFPKSAKFGMKTYSAGPSGFAVGCNYCFSKHELLINVNTTLQMHTMLLLP